MRLHAVNAIRSPFHEQIMKTLTRQFDSVEEFRARYELCPFMIGLRGGSVSEDGQVRASEMRYTLRSSFTPSSSVRDITHCCSVVRNQLH